MAVESFYVFPIPVVRQPQYKGRSSNSEHAGYPKQLFIRIAQSDLGRQAPLSSVQDVLDDIRPDVKKVVYRFVSRIFFPRHFCYGLPFNREMQ